MHIETLMIISQEVKHKAHPPQAAFTKTTVTPGTRSIPSQAREDVGITSQVIVKLCDSIAFVFTK